MNKELLERAELIRDERNIRANSANRVGQLLVDMITESACIVDFGGILDTVKIEKDSYEGQISAENVFYTTDGKFPMALVGVPCFAGYADGKYYIDFSNVFDFSHKAPYPDPTKFYRKIGTSELYIESESFDLELVGGNCNVTRKEFDELKAKVFALENALNSPIRVTPQSLYFPPDDLRAQTVTVDSITDWVATVK